MSLEIRKLLGNPGDHFPDNVIGTVTCPHCHKTFAKVLNDRGRRVRDPACDYIESHYDKPRDITPCSASNKPLSDFD